VGRAGLYTIPARFATLEVADVSPGPPRLTILDLILRNAAGRRSWQLGEDTLLMEAAMTGQQTPQHTGKYQRLTCALEMIADWVRQQREAIRTGREFAEAGEEMSHIAHDLGLSTAQLRDLAAKGPRAADELRRLLKALDLDVAKLEHDQPMVMRDLEQVCSLCTHKRECDHDLAEGTAAPKHARYCPNADTLRALRTEPM